MNKKIGIQMSLLMAVTVSFCLSLTGNLTSGNFQPVTFLITFAASFVISCIIGLVVPMQKVESGLVRACGLKERSLPARAVSSLVSDIIYTPVVTLAMIALVRKIALSHGAKLPPFGIMYVKSLVISLIVAFIVIFIVSPVFMKLVLKKNGVGGPPPGERK